MKMSQVKDFIQNMLKKLEDVLGVCVQIGLTTAEGCNGHFGKMYFL